MAEFLRTRKQHGRGAGWVDPHGCDNGVAFHPENSSNEGTRGENRYLNRCYTDGRCMAISQELLDILVCPACKAKVVLKEDGGGLRCEGCHRVYPVRDDIPIMLIDQATIEH